MELIKYLNKLNCGKIIINPSMKNYTTYKVGGVASAIVSPYNEVELIKLIKGLRANKINYKIIGFGSNLIFDNSGYDGVLIKLDEFDTLLIDKNKVIVGAGYPLIKLAYKVSRLGLSGLEFASGIPGTVGGGVFMNAGAYKSDISTILKSVKVIDEDLNIIKIEAKDMEFAYRHSILMEKKYICIEATLELTEGDSNEIMERIKERKERRLISQPLEYPTAGSVFRNPQDMYAGAIIEQLGLKGFNIGGAYISEKHANFVINKGDATGDDIIKLIYYIKDLVKKEKGIDLIIEQEIVK